MKKKRVIVIGAGASGLMAAIIAARQNVQVLCLEKNDMAGKKLIATGNGKCNFTNSWQEPNCYYSQDPAFVASLLNAFSYQDSIDFFQSIGLSFYEKNGYYYPLTNEAKSVRDCLAMECQRLGVTIEYKEAVIDISKEDQQFLIQTEKKRYFSSQLIISTGGLSAPKTGSVGDGYLWCKAFGHHINQTLPALVAVQCVESFYAQLFGLRIRAEIKLLVNDKVVGSDMGEIQFTKTGVSGIPVFQISRYVSQALFLHQQVKVCLDFFPETSLQELTQHLSSLFYQLGETKNAYEALVGLLPHKLISVILSLLHIKANKKAQDITKQQIASLALCLKNFKSEVTSTKGFESAQITSGGVMLDEVHRETMESDKVKGLYFTGELLDIDGICGGYNLHLAWSSGYVAGLSAAKEVLD